MATQFSHIQIKGNSWDKILTMRLSGKLTKENYEQFVPDIERMAVIGDKAWEKGMALLAKPFTKAKVKYFYAHQTDTAESWVIQDS